jgi:hypothetical protein
MISDKLIASMTAAAEGTGTRCFKICCGDVSGRFCKEICVMWYAGVLKRTL